ncbi:hypothetical protein RDWZM_002228 [Blomia tropicalis]|uniref:Uncharacterized protein n=1 Tax=Blomia tropicalis TaxID=40697 RepID=A0A9Q0MCE3_BLOTA|nr:hypothetical protein RDWZM_002228 [Blomia tropicalis]
MDKADDELIDKPESSEQPDQMDNQPNDDDEVDNKSNDDEMPMDESKDDDSIDQKEEDISNVETPIGRRSSRSTKYQSEKKPKPQPKSDTSIKRGEKRKSSPLDTPAKSKLPKFEVQPVSLTTKTIYIKNNVEHYYALDRPTLTTIPTKEGSYGVGDLIWAKMTGYPWWPCIISIDPETGNYCRISGKCIFILKLLYIKLNYLYNIGSSCKADRVYHVQYFGPEAYRGWTAIGMVMPFEGIEKFYEKINEEISDLPKKKVSKVLEKCNVKPSIKKKWNESVSEAELALKLDRKERVNKLTFNYVVGSEAAATAAARSRKSQLDSIMQSTPSSTSGLQSSSSVTSKTPKEKKGTAKKRSASGKKGKAMNQSSEDVYDFDEDSEKLDNEPFPSLCFASRRPKGDFDVYCREHLDEETEAHPEMNKSEVIELLKQRWDELSEEMRSVFIERKAIYEDDSNIYKSLKFKCNKKIDKTFQIGIEIIGPEIKFYGINENVESTPSSKANVSDPLSNPPDMWVKKLCSLDESADETSGSDAASVNDEIGSSKKVEEDRFCYKCGDEELTQSNILVKCSGICRRMFHQKCIGDEFNDDPDNYYCLECETNEHKCFACNNPDDLETKKCESTNCGKFYHLSCIEKFYPVQVNETANSFICPLHTCLTCIRHDRHINVNHCFSCLSGGNLICCESCPAAFHESCLEYTFDHDKSFYCGGCTSRKQLRYGDIIWAKLGIYRWWPGKICHPNIVPENVMKLSHNVGEFPVYFFGSKDYSWVNKGRAYLFVEGDKQASNNHANKTGGSKPLTNKYKLALKEASAGFEEWCNNRKEIASKTIATKPAPYQHINSNRYLNKQNSNGNSTEDHSHICDCKETSDCSDDSCLNRISFFECDPKQCPTGDRCKNQRFRTELTFNYNLDCRGNEKVKCECGSSKCSGFIGGKKEGDDGETKTKSKLMNGTSSKTNGNNHKRNKSNYYIFILFQNQLPDDQYLCDDHRMDDLTESELANGATLEENQNESTKKQNETEKGQNDELSND